MKTAIPVEATPVEHAGCDRAGQVPVGAGRGAG